MTPALLAAIHGLCFTTPRAWSEAEFESILDGPGVFLLPHDYGFLIGRVIADEAELLTVAVHPNRQRHGIGRGLVEQFLDEAAARGARTAFLEVGQRNKAARALYTDMGFTETGRRKDYYRTPEGGAVDALTLSRPLAP